MLWGKFPRWSHQKLKFNGRLLLTIASSSWQIGSMAAASHSKVLKIMGGMMAPYQFIFDNLTTELLPLECNWTCFAMHICVHYCITSALVHDATILLQFSVGIRYLEAMQLCEIMAKSTGKAGQSIWTAANCLPWRVGHKMWCISGQQPIL